MPTGEHFTRTMLKYHFNKHPHSFISDCIRKPTDGSHRGEHLLPLNQNTDLCSPAQAATLESFCSQATQTLTAL